MDRLADILINSPALPYRRNNGGEVVVCKNHIGSGPGHIGAAFPHGAADVRCPEGRSVVDSIAGHGHHFAGFLQGTHNLYFMFRRNPGKNIAPGHFFLQRTGIHGIQIFACKKFPAFLQDPQLSGNSRRSGCVIPGNHYRADSSLTAQTYCFFRLGAGWVHHSNKPTKGEIFFQTGPILRQFGDIPEGYSQHPQRLRSHCLILLQQFCFFPSSKRKISSFYPDMTA